MGKKLTAIVQNHLANGADLDKLCGKLPEYCGTHPLELCTLLAASKISATWKHVPADDIAVEQVKDFLKGLPKYGSQYTTQWKPLNLERPTGLTGTSIRPSPVSNADYP